LREAAQNQSDRIFCVSWRFDRIATQPTCEKNHRQFSFRITGLGDDAAQPFAVGHSDRVVDYVDVLLRLARRFRFAHQIFSVDNRNRGAKENSQSDARTDAQSQSFREKEQVLRPFRTQCFSSATRPRIAFIVQRHALEFAAATTFCAAFARSSAAISSIPLSFSNCFPRSTLVPSRRTTSGTESLTVLAALMMPSAITSHFMIPPKIFTRMAFTFLSAVRILNASVTCSSVAPPPTSRKFAGSPP